MTARASRAAATPAAPAVRRRRSFADRRAVPGRRHPYRARSCSCRSLPRPMAGRASSDIAGRRPFVEIPVGGTDAARVAGLDPLFVNGVCRLQLAEDPAAITVEARDRFWSLALYDPQRHDRLQPERPDRGRGPARHDRGQPGADAELTRRRRPREIEETIVVESTIGRADRAAAPVRADRRRARGCAPHPCGGRVPSRAPRAVPAPASGGSARPCAGPRRASPRASGPRRVGRPVVILDADAGKDHDFAARRRPILSAAGCGLANSKILAMSSLPFLRLALAICTHRG